MTLRISDPQVVRRDRSVLNGPLVSVDEIIPITNLNQQMDLSRMLFYTPYKRRPAVAAAYLGITMIHWCKEAGLPRETVYQWFYGRAAFPLGGALRLARVLGLMVDELFEGFVR